MAMTLEKLRELQKMRSKGKKTENTPPSFMLQAPKKTGDVMAPPTKAQVDYDKLKADIEATKAQIAKTQPRYTEPIGPKSIYGPQDKDKAVRDAIGKEAYADLQKMGGRYDEVLAKNNSLDAQFKKKHPEAAKILADKDMKYALDNMPAAGAAFASALDSASLGLFSRLNQEELKKQGLDPEEYDPIKVGQKKYPVTSTIGAISGYAVPGAALEKTAGAALKPLIKNTPKIVQQLIRGGVAGGTAEVAEGNIRGLSAQETALRAAVGIGTGGVVDVGLYGIGKGLSAGKKALLDKALPTDKMSSPKPIPSGVTPDELPKQPVNEMLGGLPEEPKKVPVALKLEDGTLKRKTAPRGKITVVKTKDGKISAKTTPKIEETEDIPVDSVKSVNLSPKKGSPVMNKAVELPTAPTTNQADEIILPPSKTASKTQTSGNTGISKFKQTVKQSEATGEQLKKTIDNSPPAEYDKVTNKDEWSVAAEKVNKNVDEVATAIRQKQSFNSSQDTHDALAAIDKLEADGEFDKANELLDHVSQVLSKSGQIIQAGAMWSRRTPVGMLKYAERVIDKAIEKAPKGVREKFAEIRDIQKRITNIEQKMKNATGDELEDLTNTRGIDLQLLAQKTKELPKAWQDIELTPDQKKFIVDNIKKSKDTKISEEAREKALDEVFNFMANKIPSSRFEKYNAWRRVAMLGNPVTQSRNILGNLTMMALRKTADKMGGAAEAIQQKRGKITQGQRTKSVVSYKFNKDVKNAVDSDWQVMKKKIGKSDRFDIVQVLGREKRIFKGETLNKMDNFVKRMLSEGDYPFLGNAYRDALGGYMIGRGLKQVTPEAREYATRRALEATFRDNSRLASWLNKVKYEGPGIGKVLAEGSIPFTKTPINISKRAWEYSPLGLIDALYRKNISKSDDAVMFIERFAKGMTGSSIFVLGAMLSYYGLITNKSESGNAGKFQKSAGITPFSLRIGNRSYPYTWASPISVPLAMGAAFQESWENDPNKFKAFVDGVTAGGEAWISSSILQNVKEFSNNDTITETLIENIVDYGTQGVPSALGQAARIADPFERKVDYKQMPPVESVQSKIPVLRTKLQPQVDINTGEFIQKSDLQRWIENTISPVRVSKETSEMENELWRLYKSFKGKDEEIGKIFPKQLKSQYKDVKLTPSEQTEIQQDLGRQTKSALDSLMGSTPYRVATDEQKISSIKKTIDNVYKKIKAQYGLD